MKAYYKNSNFTLYQSNCLDILAHLEPSSVDMIFADPPYNLSNGGITCKNGKMTKVNKGKWDKSEGVDKDYEFHKSWISACHRLLKPNGSIWISGTYHSIYQCGFSLQKKGYHILNEICWFKPNASPNLSCRYFTASHETLIWARKSKQSKHRFNYKAMKKWENNYTKSAKCHMCGNKIDIEILHQKGKQMRSVWAIPTPPPSEKREGKHPTQKPIELLKRIITASTKRGDLVLDPFTGSSTTGIASYLLGRNFIGIDLEKKFLDLSIRRFEALQSHSYATNLLKSNKKQYTDIPENQLKFAI